MEDKRRCVVFCRCRANVVPEEKLKEIISVLKNLNIPVFELQDLCAVALHEKSVLDELGREFQEKVVVACYPRAVKNIFRQTGIHFGSFEVLNYKELSASEINTLLKKKYFLQEGKALHHVYQSALMVPAWFPVIDEVRCINCGKCARFCLFGVYHFSKDRLMVVNPLACKNNCPACGRTCPASAIIFPRLKEKSVLSGDTPEEDGKIKGSESLFVLLTERNKARKNIFREGTMTRALEERRQALEELKASLQIKKK